MPQPPVRPHANSIADLLIQLGGTLHAMPAPLDGALDIGVFGGLSCWEVTSTDNVRRLATRMARLARCGLVFGTDAGSNRVAVAATLSPVRVVACPLHRDARPLARLAASVAGPYHSALEQLVAAAAALDTDAAGRRTFRLLRDLLERGAALLPARVRHDTRLSWLLLQVTRLLFLRFVESEGWLDRRSAFLREEFDRCLVARRDPQRHLLQPLFFGTLNRPMSSRSRLTRSFGDIPFLNGGLFEPHPVERRYPLHLPTDFWCDVFASIVDRVEVTLDHHDTGDAVTPEMLGTVFEGVMRPDERRAAGAFYTPSPLVHAVVRAALRSHVALRLGRSEDAVDRALDDPDPQLQRTLLRLNVLDPAVGSGAFLVGALDMLHGPGPRNAARVRHLVTRRLHGVDRHPGAVRLCEMRLWLEVLRAMRGCDALHLEPLPNLDAAVRAGDVLADPLMRHPVPPRLLVTLRQRQRAIPSAHDAAHRMALRALRRAERTVLLESLGAHEENLERAIADIVAVGASATLFGQRTRLRPAARKALAALRNQRREARRERRRLENDASAATFALRPAFAPVFQARGGFDLVVGNPPWVRGQSLPAATRLALASRFRWWRGGTSGRWTQLPDLSIAFLERAFDALAPDGTLALLVPAKVVTAGYAGAARGELAHHATLHRVADLCDDPRAEFDATTYPLAIVASRRLPSPEHRVQLDLMLQGPSVPQAAWCGSATWSTCSPALQTLHRQLSVAHPPLEASHPVQLGVKTGLNEAFIDPPSHLDRWCIDAVRGAEVRAFSIRQTRRLLWPADGRGQAWASLPSPVREHLQPFETRLRARTDLRGERWWQLFRTLPATAPHRVCWSDLAQRLDAVPLERSGPVPLNSCYVVVATDPPTAGALAAWLNTTWMRALARVTAEPASGGYARFAARVVGALPLPSGVSRSAALADASRRALRGEDVQEEIDDLGATLLDLTSDDRALLAALAADRR